MAERGVLGLALACFDLQPGLDHIARCGQVGRGHTGDGTGGKKLDNAKLVGGSFAEEVALQVCICGEVNGREGNYF